MNGRMLPAEVPMYMYMYIVYTTLVSLVGVANSLCWMYEVDIPQCFADLYKIHMYMYQQCLAQYM